MEVPLLAVWGYPPRPLTLRWPGGWSAGALIKHAKAGGEVKKSATQLAGRRLRCERVQTQHGLLALLCEDMKNGSR